MEMHVHPELRSIWDTLPEQDFGDLAAARRKLASSIEPLAAAAGVDCRDVFVPALGGEAPAVRVQIFTPGGVPDSPRAGLLWIHGGGYILGSIDAEAAFCQQLATDLDAVVCAVDYRLAPENPFPAGLEDCYSVLCWMFANASELQIDAARIGVAGNSAGGGLTAALCLLARDRQGPTIVFQMPLYPMIDDRNTTPSSYDVVDKRAWARSHNLAAWTHYLGQAVEVSPYAAPARAENLVGLPPAYTMVGTCDSLRDETIAYVARLAQAGVPVEFHLVPGGFHAFEFIVPDAPVSRRAMGEYIGALRRGLKRELTPAEGQ